MTDPASDSSAHMEQDPALQPPGVFREPRPHHLDRQWQGVAGLERARNGRLWATWYSGGSGEPMPENFVLALTSGDDGHSWSPIKVVIDPPGEVRAFDPCPWIDPTGRLWLFWAQGIRGDGRQGVWAVTTDDPGSEDPTWSPPRRLTNGIMMCKPTVLTDGRWLLPAAIWIGHPVRPDTRHERFSNVYCSTDGGKTWPLLGSADVPDRKFDEHMVVERSDGSLWMLVRTHYGIGQSVSTDGGRTWSPGEPSGIASPGSRFFLRRLRSGRLLLVNHRHFTGRSHLTASLSDDDGLSWSSHLLLDEREKAAYPDGCQGPDGTIYVIYDRFRKQHGDILMAVFTEADIDAGRCVSPAARLKQVISRLH